MVYGHRQTQKKTPALKNRVLAIKLIILKRCTFTSSFVSLLMGTYPAAAACDYLRTTVTATEHAT